MEVFISELTTQGSHKYLFLLWHGIDLDMIQFRELISPLVIAKSLSQDKEALITEYKSAVFDTNQPKTDKNQLIYKRNFFLNVPHQKLIL